VFGKCITITYYNNNSLVLKIKYGQTTFLFPGDLEKEGEAALVDLQGQNLRSDVLLASHHGGRDSLTTAFLEMVRPKYVVISSGQYNRFSLPSGEALERAEKIGAEIFRTDRDGAVTFETDGGSIKVKTWN